MLRGPEYPETCRSLRFVLRSDFDPIRPFRYESSMRYYLLAAFLVLSICCTVAYAQATLNPEVESDSIDPDVTAVEEFVSEIREPVLAARAERAEAIENAIAAGSGSWLERYIATRTGGGRLSEADRALYVDDLSIDSYEDLYQLEDESGTVSFLIVGLEGGDKRWVMYLNRSAAEDALFK